MTDTRHAASPSIGDPAQALSAFTFVHSPVVSYVAEVAEAAAEMAAEAVAVAMVMLTRPTDEGRTDGCVAAGRAEDESPVPPR